MDSMAEWAASLAPIPSHGRSPQVLWSYVTLAHWQPALIPRLMQCLAYLDPETLNAVQVSYSVSEVMCDRHQQESSWKLLGGSFEAMLEVFRHCQRALP